MDMEVEMSSIPLTVEEDACSIFTKTKHPVLLKFEDVFYKINTQEKAFCSLKKSKMGSEKVILKGMTGLVLPGEMLAMLGPSGSGKTTLLTALGGRLGGDLSGSITYNGKPFNNAMKRNTGFVTQDDVLYAHLTVYETLVFTALLRLPKCLSRSEKEEHAKKVMDQLGLTKCKDIMIGGPLLRGVSGGERKRVSIGQEMLVNPSLLLLDEPTSGLDSTTAQNVVSTLSELAGGGTTVVMTIHQPSSKLYYMFHKILLLSDGRPLYFGKGSEALNYFSSIGHAPTVSMNPSDVLLDLANGILPWNNVEADEKAVKQALADAYEEKVVGKLKAELESYRAEWCMEESSNEMGEWSCNWWEQFTILLARGVKERRHEAFSGLKVGQVIAVAIIAGLLWWRSDVAHLQDQVGLLFFYSTFWGMFPLFEAIFTFPDEQAMLIKERASGMYRLSSYFMARTVVDMPMEMALPTLFVTISYLMAGLRPTLAHFLATLSAVLLAVLVSQGLGLALGALFMNLKMASTLGSVFMLTSLLAGGYYVQHVPFFIAWIKYISLTHHTYKLLLLSQYSPEQTYPCPTTISCKVADFPTIKLVGLDYDDHPLFSMFLMLLGYRLIAYTSLMRVGVTR